MACVGVGSVVAPTFRMHILFPTPTSPLTAPPTTSSLVVYDVFLGWGGVAFCRYESDPRRRDPRSLGDLKVVSSPNQSRDKGLCSGTLGKEPHLPLQLGLLNESVPAE